LSRATPLTCDGKSDHAVACLCSSFPIPYYAVGFIQVMPDGIIRRASIASPSPSMIRQRIENLTNPNDGPVRWEPHPFPSRRLAQDAAHLWMSNGQ
jgi:hypothetical protein